MKDLPVAERLIIAADFEPSEAAVAAGRARVEVVAKVMMLAAALQGLGVYLKMNSALRAGGYGLIDLIRAMGLKVFADLKIFDIPETMKIDGMLLREANPELLTVACPAGPRALKALKDQLPNTEVLGVTALTYLTDEETDAMFVCSTMEAVERFAKVAKAGSADGFISSAKEAPLLRAGYGTLMTINAPGIRFEDQKVANDDQNQARVLTPYRAIKAGVDRIVMGRPITGAENPREAAQRALTQISMAL